MGDNVKEIIVDNTNIVDEVEANKLPIEQRKTDKLKTKKVVEKVYKEKLRKEKLENKEKQKLENQRKTEAKREKKERERRLKLAELENQQILKEKWQQQENSKIDHTPKIINELNNKEDASPKEKDDADTMKKKQISDHQQVLKQRWIEIEEEEKFYKQTKKQELCKSKYEVEATDKSQMAKETKLEKTKDRND